MSIMKAEMTKNISKIEELDKKVASNADRGSIKGIDESKKLFALAYIGVLYAITQAPAILQSFIH